MTPLTLWAALAAVCFAVIGWPEALVCALALTALLIFTNAAPPQE